MLAWSGKWRWTRKEVGRLRIYLEGRVDRAGWKVLMGPGWGAVGHREKFEDPHFPPGGGPWSSGLLVQAAFLSQAAWRVQFPGALAQQDLKSDPSHYSGPRRLPRRPGTPEPQEFSPHPRLRPPVPAPPSGARPAIPRGFRPLRPRDPLRRPASRLGSCLPPGAV